MNDFKRISIFTVACILGIVTHCMGQDINIAAVSKKLNTYIQQTVTEKLYVHTDKDYYLAGEIMWLKVYDVDAVTNNPIDFSKVAYVEIMDTANTPLLQLKIALNKTTGNGAVSIPQSFNSGIYTLRAYTRWMRNMCADAFFEKRITIMNLNKLPGYTNTQKANGDSLPVKFFPEGGNLVSGMENTVAFSTAGNSVKNIFKGYLITGKDTVLRFAPQLAGMGSLKFTPADGKNYEALIVSESGKNITVSLPQVHSRGIVMHVTDDAENFTIKTNANTADKVLHMIAHSKGIVKAAATARLQNGAASFFVKKSDLEEGVSIITIFNEAGKPVCERLVFIYPDHEINLQVKTDLTEYKPRAGVKMDLTALAGMGNTDSARLSVSVYRLDSLQQVPATNITSYLLLTSELGSYVENAAYYLEKNNSLARDLLLMTKGWRRFNWDKILSGVTDTIRYQPELQGHLVTGKITSDATGEPAAKVEAYLSAPSVITLFKATVSNAEGTIKANFNNFFGGDELIGQTKKNGYSISIDNPFSEIYKKVEMPPLFRYTAFPNTLLQQQQSILIQNIYNSEKLYNFSLPAFADTGAFYGKPDNYYNLENYTRFTSIEEIIREYVVLVDVRLRNKEVNLFMNNVFKKEYFSNPPLNLLDGVPVFNFTKFFELDPLKLRSLDVVTQQYVSGTTIFDGILNWKSYKPSVSNYQLDSGTAIINYEGLLLAREFYSPAYDTEKKIQSHIPDYRNVLLWEPDIVLKNETKNLGFYTGDIPGQYVIIVQGIASNGATGSAQLIFKVE